MPSSRDVVPSCGTQLRVAGQSSVYPAGVRFPPSAKVEPDHEHDAFAWWPPDVADWPEEAHDDLRQIPALLMDGGRGSPSTPGPGA